MQANEHRTVAAAYFGVILLWTTTPLAIKWSTEGSHFLFGVTFRMAIGALVCLLLLHVRRLPLPRGRRAWQACVACGLGIYGGMTGSYWASQYIPSGWISVVFGLSPVLTGVMAALWLGERMTPGRVGGMLLGLAGLMAIFGQGALIGARAGWAIAAIVLAAAVQAAGSVWVKRLADDLPVLTLTTVGVTLASLLELLTWLVSGIGWPTQVTTRALLCTVYLGLGGSVLGFILYFYVLMRIEATKVALITLITPISALLLGRLLNGEKISLSIVAGTAAILLGLILFQFSGRRLPRLTGNPAKHGPG